jgi:pimeloyl-ACP methyl ester carboxylesterase
VQAIRGGRDPIFLAPVWQVLERARPDWELVTLPDIGHVPQLEAPEEVALHLTEWSERLLVASPGSTPP